MKKLILLAVLLSSSLLFARVQLVGKVKRGDGTLFNGKVVVTLPVATQDTSLSEAVCPCQFEYPVQNGTFPSNAFLVATDVMSPSNVYYIMQFFDPYGNLKMTLNAANVIDAAGTYDIGQATPTAITTAQISYITPASLSANQVWTGNNSFTQPIASTLATGTPPLTITSTTPVPNLGASHLASDNSPVAATTYPTSPIRLAKDDKICWRNSDNTNDNCIYVKPGIGFSALDRPYLTFSGQTYQFATQYAFIGENFGNFIVVNSNTETTLSGSPLSIAANDLHQRDIYRAHADGVLSNTSGGNITYTFRLRLDNGAGTLLCASAGVVVATGSVAVPFHLECDFTVQTDGAGGTISPWGNYTVNATTGDIANAALVAVDTTLGHTPAFTGQMSVANANGSFTTRQLWMERLAR